MHFYPALIIFVTVAAVAAPKKIEIPNDTSYFRLIDSLARHAKWAPLQHTDLPSGSLEIRVWVGFGTQPLRGIRIRRDVERWTGIYIREELPGEWPFETREVKPKNWTELWKTVEALGILTLPDSSTLPKDGFTLDGVGCAVEINDGTIYRVYHYSNPQARKWPEAKQIDKIVGLLLQELILHDRYIISDWNYGRNRK